MLKKSFEERGLLALSISHKSAEIALEYLGKAKQWDKKDSSPVTEADLAIDKQLQADISEAYPDDAILSEEGVDEKERLNKDFCWVIDPIDGTKEFIRQSPDFCVMIGICYKGDPVFGVINIPKTGEIFYGGPGFGVSMKRNGEVVNLPEAQLHGEDILVSRSSSIEVVRPYFEERNMKAIPIGSSGVKACRLIDGTAQHYIHGTTIHEWDTAAADALVRGYGGFFTAMNGERFRYNKIKPTIDGVIASFNQEKVQDISSFFEDRLTFN